MQAKKKTLLTESRFGAQPSTPTRRKLSSTSSSSHKPPANHRNFKVTKIKQISHVLLHKGKAPEPEKCRIHNNDYFWYKELTVSRDGYFLKV